MAKARVDVSVIQSASVMLSYTAII